MDTLTHIVLGACIGEVTGKKLGKKALLLGAVAANIPDIDFVASFWLPIHRDVLAHRGFTHSILFAVLLTPLLAMASRRLVKGSDMRLGEWYLFWGLQILVHLFIDCFNAYGTGLFIPFSAYRVSFNAIYVADPLFSIWPAIALITLLIAKTTNTRRRIIAKTGICLSAIYLFLCLINKQIVGQAVAKNIEQQKLVARDYFTTPTLLNSLLWYVVIKSDSGYYVGYRSILDKTPTITFRYAYRNDSLLRLTNDKKELSDLLQFAQGYYTVEMRLDTVTFNVLRFGETMGAWDNPKLGFAFYYYLQHPGSNNLIVQRGRFAKRDKATLQSFINRIEGR